MSWDFTPELVDQIIYSMEDQEGEYYLDFRTGEIAGPDHLDMIEELEEGDRYFELPEWRSHEGFQLMERFVAGLRNPLHRESLREALSTGRGVFRQFKNALRGRPELEKLWYRYKEREMRRIVYDWYNQICEARGLAQMEPPEIDTEELILSDFSLSDGPGEHLEALTALDMDNFAVAHSDGDEDDYLRDREGRPDLADSIVIKAVTPGGEFAGFAWGAVLQGREDTVQILQLAVVADYRGLGLGRALLEELIRSAERLGASRTIVDLEGPQMELASFLQSEGFTVAAQRMELDLDSWSQERE
jgi:ribosomal protein S18 acetylase RimI-like enzyme